MNDPRHAQTSHYGHPQWSRSQQHGHPLYPASAYGASAHHNSTPVIQQQQQQQQQYAYGYPPSSVPSASPPQAYAVPSMRTPTYPSPTAVQSYAVPQHPAYHPPAGADSVANGARHHYSHSRSYSVPQPSYGSPTYAYDEPTQEGMEASMSDYHLQEQFPASPQRPFACDMCPLSFARQHDLKRHRETHSGEKPFVCNGGCGKTFTRKDALKRHQLVKRCGTDSTA